MTAGGSDPAKLVRSGDRRGFSLTDLGYARSCYGEGLVPWTPVRQRTAEVEVSQNSLRGNCLEGHVELVSEVTADFRIS